MPLPADPHSVAARRDDSRADVVPPDDEPIGGPPPDEPGEETARDAGREPVAAGEPPAPPVRIFAAEPIVEEVALIDERSWPRRIWNACCSAIEWTFGLFCMVFGLAVLASLPILQFLSLGYLLEASGRISRSGRIRDGFIGIRRAAQAGSIVLGTWLMLLPLRFVADLAQSARLIDPNSAVAAGWQIGLFVTTGLVVAHILLAWYCGGKLRHFFWPLLAPPFFCMWGLHRAVASRALRPLVQPLVGTISPRLLRDITTVPPLADWFPPAVAWKGIRRGQSLARARDTVWDFVISLRTPYFLWLGMRGFAGAIAWLFLPIVLIIATTKLGMNNPDAAGGLGALAGLTGSFLLMLVLLYLPFLQAHFAAENRFVAFFEVGRVRAMFKRAPLAFWFALFITLLFALPLYLLKIEFVQRELVWVLSLVFVAFVFPARLLMGWAVGRARRHERPRFFLFRWLARLGEFPVVAFYVLIVYFTQYFSWYGSWSLFEQHAFLMPVPFLGL